MLKGGDCAVPVSKMINEDLKNTIPTFYFYYSNDSC